MQGVRWSEDDLAAHQARMARHRPSPAGTHDDHKSFVHCGTTLHGQRLDAVTAGLRTAEEMLIGNAATEAQGQGVTGGERPAPKSRRNDEEDRLQQAVAQLLDRALPADYRWFHTPNGGKRSKKVAGILKSFGVKAGVADVMILRPGSTFVWIELKASRGCLNPSQRDWRDWCHSIGAPWFLCRSIEDVIAACQDAAVPLRLRAVP